MNKHGVLKQYFGYEDFRPGQEALADSILAGRDTLGVMPTGAGKSICFQVPAMLLPGITLVISPLISLMTDQVNALRQSGINAAYINSSLTPAQSSAVIRNAANGMYKLIYAAPERLEAEAFVRFAAAADISMITVDEAHCISQWGQDFRPSYLGIPSFVNKLAKRPIISAFTATATKAVRDDIIKILRLNSPNTFVTGFDRKNLYFGVMNPKNKLDALLALIKEYTGTNGRSGIIYCSTRKNVETVCSRLADEGYPVTRYHAGLSEAERSTNQDDFTYDRKRIMVATNAFGMGIDKSNVSYVIHYNMPKDVESYYQEAGRAGRDGSPADCILLYSGQDVMTNRFLIDKSRSNSELDSKTADFIHNKDMQRLKYMTFYCTAAECLRSYILGYFGEKAPAECGNCSFCCSDSPERDITVEAQKIMSCIYRCGQRYGKTIIAMVLRGSKNSKLLSAGLDRQSTYGIMKGCSEKEILLMIDKLIFMGYISVSDDGYSTLSLTSQAYAVLKGKKRISARIPETDKSVDKQSEEKHRTSKLVLREEDKELMLRLKALRSKIASQNGVPAYVIFNDATLHEMCCTMPTDEKSLLKISGVGNVKLERFGNQFIKVIAQYAAEKCSDNTIDTAQSASLADEKIGIDALVYNRSMIDFSEEAIPITVFVSSMLTYTGTRNEVKPVMLRTAITEWLIKKGLIKMDTDENGRKHASAAAGSEKAGIRYVMRINEKGERYKGLLYTPYAQKYITEHLDEIAEIYRKLSDAQ